MCNSTPPCVHECLSPFLPLNFFFISGTKIFECFTEKHHHHHQHDHRHYWSFHLFLIRARKIIYDPISGPPKWLLPKNITDREGRIIMRLWAEICIRTISGQIRVLLRLITKHMALRPQPRPWLMRWLLLGLSNCEIVRNMAQSVFHYCLWEMKVSSWNLPSGSLESCS